MDVLQPFIQASESQKAFPVYPKVDYTMYSTEVQEYMKKSFPNVNNIVICGLEVGETGVVKSRPMCA